jgi:hypothetical protein
MSDSTPGDRRAGTPHHTHTKGRADGNSNRPHHLAAR